MTDGPPPRVFVTGANGFIGSALRHRLERDGVDVRGVDLRAGKGVVAGDITETDTWARELAGVDAVVHTAAVVTFAGDPDRFWRVNVLGTRRVLEAARAHGVRRVVVLSSVVVFGFDFPDGADETWPVRPNGSPYVDTKIATEQVTLQAHAGGELETVILRPGDVYGPRGPQWTLAPIEELRRGRGAVPSGGGLISPVYVDNLVDAIVAAAHVPGAAGEVLTVSDGVGVPVRDFFARYAAMIGARPPRELPAAVLRPAAELLRRIDGVRGRESHLSSFTIDYLARTKTYSNAKARRVLGWEPVVGLDDGFARTEAWLHETGVI